MAAITASDITPTANMALQDIGNLLKMSICKVTFGDGALTYPTGGIPLPAVGQFGFWSIEFVGVQRDSGAIYIYIYDKANHKILFADPATGAEEADTATPAATVLTLFMVGR